MQNYLFYHLVMRYAIDCLKRVDWPLFYQK